MINLTWQEEFNANFSMPLSFCRHKWLCKTANIILPSIVVFQLDLRVNSRVNSNEKYQNNDLPASFRNIQPFI